MVRLAHQDPDVVAEYYRRGWWGTETVGDVVHGHAMTKPEATAFIDDDSRMSWREYDRIATDIAQAIVAAGIDRGARVAVMLPHSGLVHAAYVGAERAGVTVVGIGDRAGEQEIAHLVRTTDAVGLVTLAEHRSRPSRELGAALGIAPAHHLVLPLTAPPAPADLTPRAYGPDDVFMINSTSGTTGLPKCVLHNENRWMFFHQLAQRAADFDAHDVFCSLLPAPFGFGLWTAHFTPAVLGAPTLVTGHFDADRALAAIERERVTVLACVSTQFLMMLESPAIGTRDLTSLRCMFTGGEAVPYEQAARFEDLTGARVLQFYGSNETGALTGTTMRDHRDQRLRTAGKPLPEMNVRLVDDDGRDITQPGRPGHPICRGPATCLGYLDDDAANAELFTDDGFMRIGDLAAFDADGYLRVVGRTSDIIIRGGKNISAPAIEAEIATHEAVALAAAVAMPDPIFGERVCAYVQLRPGHALTLDELTAHLAQRGVSKEWMPEHLVVLDELPRASGGKIAKGQLRTDIRDRLAAHEPKPG